MMVKVVKCESCGRRIAKPPKHRIERLGGVFCTDCKPGYSAISSNSSVSEPEREFPKPEKKFPELKEEDTTETREGTCLLCHEEKKLIWHHWDYEENIGCWLCQSCHTYIHNGLGISDFPWSNVLQRLTYRYIKTYYPNTYERIERGNIAAFSRRIKEIFNIPFDESFVYGKVYKVVKQYPKDTSRWVWQGIVSERIKMDISEKQMRIMKALEEVSPRFGMKANRIANELYGPPSNGRKRLRNGHEIVKAIQELSEEDLVKDVKDGTSQSPVHWILTDKGRNLLREMKA